MDSEETSTYVPTADNVVDPSTAAHISLVFTPAPSQPQIDEILYIIREKLDLSFEVRQTLERGTRIVFVPSDGEMPEEEEKLEALVALFWTWIEDEESTVGAYTIVQ